MIYCRYCRHTAADDPCCSRHHWGIVVCAGRNFRFFFKFRSFPGRKFVHTNVSEASMHSQTTQSEHYWRQCIGCVCTWMNCLHNNKVRIGTSIRLCCPQQRR